MRRSSNLLEPVSFAVMALFFGAVVVFIGTERVDDASGPGAVGAAVGAAVNAVIVSRVARMPAAAAPACPERARPS